ncbi:hypothetical protein ZWY2020_001569 [Hordeum vulgare]|nr:hypothetical protein ZWY2020_001569 [Hordeum vulgare]
MQELPFSPRNREGLSMPFLGLAALLLLFFASPNSSCIEQENNSLINFLDGLMPDGNGGLNVSWVKGTDCCKWEGIICSSDGTVTDVLLASRGLKGGISPSLGNLTGLLHLNLSQNSLESSLPTELVFSRSIIGLDVSFNRLKGHLQEMQSSNPSLPLQEPNVTNEDRVLGFRSLSSITYDSDAHRSAFPPQGHSHALPASAAGATAAPLTRARGCCLVGETAAPHGAEAAPQCRLDRPRSEGSTDGVSVGRRGWAAARGELAIGLWRTCHAVGGTKEGSSYAALLAWAGPVLSSFLLFFLLPNVK